MKLFKDITKNKFASSGGSDRLRKSSTKCTENRAYQSVNTFDTSDADHSAVHHIQEHFIHPTFEQTTVFTLF